jgi:hypothetical protein
MKKKFVAVGVLAGGIALTGLAGSAYAQGGTPTAKPTGPKGKGATAIICVAKGEPIKGKPEKGAFSIKEPGKLPPLPPGAPALKVRSGGKALPAPPPGAKIAKGAVEITTKDGAHGIPKLGPLPKGVHCTVVKPGTPGAPPVPPAR